MRRGPEAWGEGFPYDVPAVAALEELSLDAPITLLAGDNGSGKSTIVEAIAAAMGFAAEGGELERSGELPLSTGESVSPSTGRGTAVMVRAGREGAQFVVATHSPVLLACPQARIYELDENGLAPCEYDDLDAVRFTRGFLDAPERFIRAALDE